MHQLTKNKIIILIVTFIMLLSSLNLTITAKAPRNVTTPESQTVKNSEITNFALSSNGAKITGPSLPIYPQYSANSAIDGNTSDETRWFASKDDLQPNEVLTADVKFASYATIDRVVFKGVAAPYITFITSYKIKLRQMDGTFITVATGNNLDKSGLDKILETPVITNFIRIEFEQQDTKGANISEISAYGIAYDGDVPAVGDKERLAETLAVAEKRKANKALYTADSFDVFEGVANAADVIYNNELATQEEIENIRNNLIDAIYTLKKATFIPHRMRVSAVGDSITYGYMGNEAETKKYSYPAQLQAMLGKGYEVKNFGNSGKTMLTKGNDPYIKTKEYRDSLAYNPDVVFIMLGTNDTKPMNLVHVHEFKENAKDLIDSYKLLESQPIIYFNTSPTIFGNGMDANQPYAITEEKLVEQILPLQKAVVKETGVRSIDVHELTKDQSANFPDHVHGNKEGYAFLAETILDEGIDKHKEIIEKEFLSFIKGKSELVKGNYSDTSWNTFTSKLAKAKQLDLATANITTIKKHRQELEDAFHGLAYVKKADFDKEQIKLATIGDSLTQGWIYDVSDIDNPNNDSYPSHLKKMLGSDFLVRNFGRNGKTVRDTPEAYVKHEFFEASKAFQPDVVIIMLGTNDAKQVRPETPQNNPNFPAYWPLELTDEVRLDYKERLEQMIAVYQNLESHPIVMMASSPTVRLFDPAYNIYPDVVNGEIAELQREVADELGVKFIDQNQLTAHTLGQSMGYDNIHGNFPEIAQHMYDGLMDDVDVQKLLFNKMIRDYSALDTSIYLDQNEVNKLKEAIKDAKKSAEKNLTLTELQAAVQKLESVKQSLAEVAGPNTNMALSKNLATLKTNSEQETYPVEFIGNENLSETDRWVTTPGATDVYLEITMREAINLNKIVLRESKEKSEWRPSKIKKIKIEVASKDGNYQQVYKGNSVGIKFTKTLKPSEVKKVKITFTPNEKGSEVGMAFDSVGLYGDKLNTK